MNVHIPLIPGESFERPELAFTTVIQRVRQMMQRQGHVVCLYESMLGGRRPEWNDHRGWRRHGEHQAERIRRNLRGQDVLSLPAGDAQRSIMDALSPIPCVEHGVGYAGTCAPWRIFPSAAWMHTVIGAQQGSHSANGTWGDVVIPHPLDPAEHELGAGEGGYLLFVGRLTERKGIDVAIRVAQEVGLPLIAAGEGEYRPDGATYIGPVATAERAELMGDAIALLAPTLYVEPFGLVVTEAQACGTPTITTDWGAFCETVPSRLRCLTLEEFTAAVEVAGDLDRRLIRDAALRRWSMDTIAPAYDRFYRRVCNA